MMWISELYEYAGSGNCQRMILNFGDRHIIYNKSQQDAYCEMNKKLVFMDAKFVE